MKTKAILSLLSDAKFVCIDEDEVTWLDSRPQPTNEAIQEKIIELQAEYDAQAYARNRQPLYPAIGDQLDDLYHAGVFSAEMTATLKKVKDDNPK